MTADRPAGADNHAEIPRARALDLDVDPPPDDLPYAAYEDHRYREICRRNGIAETPEALTRALRLDELTLRAAAAHTIGSLGMVAALPALEEAVAVSDDLVAAEVGYALARLGATSGRPVLESCLALPMNAYVAPPLAAGYLARLGDFRGAPIIERGLASDNSTVRMIAAKQLAFFVPFDGERLADGSVADVWGWFRLALADPLPDIQWQAVVELSHVSGSVADELLAGYAESGPDPAARARAVRALRARSAS